MRVRIPPLRCRRLRLISRVSLKMPCAAPALGLLCVSACLFRCRLLVADVWLSVCFSASAISSGTIVRY